MHANAAREYLMLVFDTQSGGADVQARAKQLLREAPAPCLHL